MFGIFSKKRNDRELMPVDVAPSSAAALVSTEGGRVNYSRVMQGLAESFGDREAIVNLERGRRLSFRDYHIITNQIAHILNGNLNLGAGDRYVCMLQNDNLSLFHWGSAAKAYATCCHANYLDSLETHLGQIDIAQQSKSLKYRNL